METARKTTDSLSGLDERLLRVGEAAEILGLGRSKVYEMTKTGELPVLKIGTAVRIPRRALLEWIERNTLSAA